MNKREKRLGTGLGIALGVFLCFEPASNWITGNRGDMDAAQSQAIRELQELEFEKLVAMREAASLDKWRELSLPSDPAIASVKYQEYLIRVLEKCGLNSPIVTGSAPIEAEGVGVKVQFTVQANATSMQIGSFLDQISSTELLHQITFLSISQSGGPEALEHAMTAGIEVLVLDGNKTELPSLAATRKRSRAAKALASNDIFCRPKKVDEFSSDSSGLASLLRAFTGEAGSVESQSDQKSEPVAIELPPAPPQNDIRFVGVIERGAKRLALFYDANTGNQTLVSVGEKLQDIGLDAKILGIEKDTVQMSWNQSVQYYKLGKRVELTATNDQEELSSNPVK